MFYWLDVDISDLTARLHRSDCCCLGDIQGTEHKGIGCLKKEGGWLPIASTQDAARELSRRIRGGKRPEVTDCSMCLARPADRPADPEEMKVLLSYYDIHVTHRAQLFNFMLVVVSAAGVAYASALDRYPVLAGAIAFLAAFLVFMFWGVNQVTLNKIKASKKGIVAGRKKYLDKLFGEEEGDKRHAWRGLSDPACKGAIHIVLILAFLAAGFAQFFREPVSTQSADASASSPTATQPSLPDSADGS